MKDYRMTSIRNLGLLFLTTLLLWSCQEEQLMNEIVQQDTLVHAVTIPASFGFKTVQFLQLSFHRR